MAPRTTGGALYECPCRAWSPPLRASLAGRSLASHPLQIACAAPLQQAAPSGHSRSHQPTGHKIRWCGATEPAPAQIPTVRSRLVPPVPAPSRPLTGRMGGASDPKQVSTHSHHGPKESQAPATLGPVPSAGASPHGLAAWGAARCGGRPAQSAHPGQCRLGVSGGAGPILLPTGGGGWVRGWRIGRWGSCLMGIAPHWRGARPQRQRGTARTGGRSRLSGAGRRNGQGRPARGQGSGNPLPAIGAPSVHPAPAR